MRYLTDEAERDCECGACVLVGVALEPFEEGDESGQDSESREPTENHPHAADEAELAEAAERCDEEGAIGTSCGDGGQPRPFSAALSGLFERFLASGAATAKFPVTG